MDDFVLRAMIGGVGVALVAGPLGCFVVWRRMAYFGAALSHAALLGVALGLLLGIDPMLGVGVFCVCLAVLLVGLDRRLLLASDTLLGVLAHATLALGLILFSLMEHLRVDLMGYLFGDVLAVGGGDLVLIYTVAAVIAGGLALIWRPLLSATVHEELAVVEGVPVLRVRLAFTVMIAAAIAVGMKVVGILLIVSLLIIPAAAARRLSATPEQMAVAAVAIGVLSVLLGLASSLQWDLPAGPSIVLAASLIFAVLMLAPRRGGAGSP